MSVRYLLWKLYYYVLHENMVPDLNVRPIDRNCLVLLCFLAVAFITRHSAIDFIGTKNYEIGCTWQILLRIQPLSALCWLRN